MRLELMAPEPRFELGPAKVERFFLQQGKAFFIGQDGKEEAKALRPPTMVGFAFRDAAQYEAA